MEPAIRPPPFDLPALLSAIRHCDGLACGAAASYRIWPRPESKFEGRPEFELESLHRTAMIGTPEQVIERLRHYQQLGVDEFSFWCDNSLPHQEKRRSLELFIKEVAPAFLRRPRPDSRRGCAGRLRWCGCVA